MNILSKQFTRERSFFYFYMWNDSNRMSFLKYLDHEIKNSLFFREGRENKMSVWYENEEMTEIFLAIEVKMKSDSHVFDEFKKVLKKEWDFIGQFIEGKELIADVDTFKKYYESVVRWWSAMTIIFYIPDLEGLSDEIRNEALRLRLASERYSPSFSKVFEMFFMKNFPEYEEFLHVISPAEVFILRERKFNEEEIGNFKKRLNGFALLNDEIYLLDDLKDALKNEKVALENDSGLIVGEIKGTIACQGFVKGKVRVLTRKKSFGDFKKGEILVTEMTDPDFIPVIKKASAIITDEGGMTCHAAITAREMKKPCIIGTKIATKVLKDGDFVEVDADNGIMRIIKKK